MAAMEHSEATGKLSALVGRHEEFAKAKKHTDEAHAKCLTARHALEQHLGKTSMSYARIQRCKSLLTPGLILPRHRRIIPAFSAVGILYIGGQTT